MKLSFIVLSYNQKEDVKNAINSILFASIPLNDFEIIIADNNSNDDTILMLEDFSKSEYNIRYFVNKVKKNKSISRNNGVKIANGEYIMMIDGDDYYDSVGLYNFYEFICNNNYDCYFIHRIRTRDKGLYIRRICNLSTSKNTQFGVHQYVPKRSLLIENNIWHEEDKYFFYAEDWVYTLLLVDTLFTKPYSTYEYCDIIYIHTLRDSSITSQDISVRYDKYVFLYIVELSGYLKKILSDKKSRQYLRDNVRRMTYNYRVISWK